MTDADDTAELLQRWHDGDRDALMTLVARDRDWIERRLRERRGALLRSFEETGDGVHDLMLRALDYAPRFLVANRRQFRALLLRMLGHQLADHARRAEREPRPRTVSEADASRARIGLLPDLSATPPDAAAARAEELAWMRIGLEFLPDLDRRLLYARVFEEHEFAAAGAVVGLAEDAARMRFRRALLKLAGVVQRLQHGELDTLCEREDDDGDGHA